MNHVDDLFRARLAATADTTDDADWPDVRRRARRSRIGRSALIAAAAVAAVAVVAPAFGLHRVVVDFFESEPAPERVQLDFSRLGVGAPPGLGPDVVPNSARKVMDVIINGKARTLWVAPTRSGGFCARYTGLWLTCRQRIPPTPNARSRPGELRPGLLGATFQADGKGIASLVGGAVLDDDIARITAEFADETSVELQLTWVSPPIDAGFYFYEVPENRRQAGVHLSSVVARDSGGNVVARQRFELTKAGDIERPVQLPDGELTSLPVKAIVEKARLLISFETSTGDRVKLWKMPTTEGGHCWVFDRGGGCPPVDWRQGVPLVAGIAGGRPVLFRAEVLAEVAVVELQFEDGTVERLRPVEGFVLAEIRPENYPRGHRLEFAIARSEDGRVLERQRFRPESPGVYPCERPVDIGRGVMACP